MIDRRRFGFAGLLAFGAAIRLRAATGAQLGDNGLHVQPFFMQTFLDLAEDKAEAEAEGKHFAVLFEQRGCPYCREMHEVNFARPEIAEFVASNFGVLQIDLWGSREVVDFDGEALEERALARKWGVNFTPTMVFFTTGGDGPDFRSLEAVRMPGYFKPFHFMTMFEFVAGDSYVDQPFQRYLQDKFARYEKEGKVPDLW